MLIGCVGECAHYKVFLLGEICTVNGVNFKMRNAILDYYIKCFFQNIQGSKQYLYMGTILQ